MNSRKVSVVLAMVIVLVLAACAPTGSGTIPQEAAPVPATPAPVKPTPAATTAGQDPQNATYIINGQPVTLVNGVAEQPAAPGSAEKIETKYFGNSVEVDLNADGKLDSGFLLTQTTGGSGVFFYAAAAIQNPDGSYQGTNAIFLGDRIAPQSTNVDPNNPAQFVVNYADRAPGEPMSAQPTQGVSKTLKLDNGTLVEVPPLQP
jgi:hypothetical protein